MLSTTVMVKWMIWIWVQNVGLSLSLKLKFIASFKVKF
jgi:hypothetical protein